MRRPDGRAAIMRQSRRLSAMRMAWVGIRVFRPVGRHARKIFAYRIAVPVADVSIPVSVQAVSGAATATTTSTAAAAQNTFTVATPIVQYLVSVSSIAGGGSGTVSTTPSGILCAFQLLGRLFSRCEAGYLRSRRTRDRFLRDGRMDVRAPARNVS